ncbi:MAG: nitroreductase family deazaflavin-dependent oxidoreductase [Gordonia sp. (in: high G+C Gram-positive bacteria)]|uniref:nitroreductase family deazaflavin-dependent oxidoreductase n=1 Tax=Gordonia sp. (in: high G+C Gram-positive bacteria) TaxID=84139 RepID=UPI003C725A1C
MVSIGAKALRTRWFVRMPIPLMRAGFGFLFGGRLLLLEHTGRKSGRERFVALEAVDRPTKDRVIIASGFGEKSQWYQNLQANPNCRVWIGFLRNRAATARTLPAEEASAIVERYRVKYPKAYDKLAGVIEDATGRSIEAIPYVELVLAKHPQNGRSSGA